MKTKHIESRRFASPVLTCAALAALSSPSFGQTYNTEFAAHSLRRVTFGSTIDQLAALPNVNAWMGYMAAQLAGNLAESTQFQAALASYGVPASTAANPNYGVWRIKELQQQQLLRAAFSENQLREVMTMFWQQSLSTNYSATYGYLRANASTLLNNIGGNVSIPGANDDERAKNAAAYIMYLENEAMRANALGSFEDLLLASAQSPSMLIYLNSVDNDLVLATDRANENYSRELMELHTLGVSDFTGEPYWYSHFDVAELAPAFSGWNVQAYIDPVHGQPSYRYVFDMSEHRDATGYPFTGSTTVGLFEKLIYTRGDARYGDFVFTPANSGAAQGVEAIKYLASAWETRAWVCRRLVEFFVGYRPMDVGDPLVISTAPQRPARKVPLPAGLTEAELDACYANCLVAWENGPKAGDVKSVLAAIFTSPAFWNSDARWTRAKNPLEFAASLLRAFDAEMPSYTLAPNPDNNAGDLDEFMDRIGLDLGMPLFRFPSPDGYTIKSEEIISTNGALHRANIAQEVIRDYVFYDPTGQWGGSAPGQVNLHPLGFLSPTLFETGTANQRYTNLVNYLNGYPTNTGPFDLGSKTAIADRVFLALFGGDISTNSRNDALTFFTQWEGTFPGSLLNLVLVSNPNQYPATWVQTFIEAGKATVGFMAYASALPQFQLK